MLGCGVGGLEIKKHSFWTVLSKTTWDWNFQINNSIRISLSNTYKMIYKINQILKYLTPPPCQRSRKIKLAKIILVNCCNAACYFRINFENIIHKIFQVWFIYINFYGSILEKKASCGPPCIKNVQKKIYILSNLG